MRLFDSHSHLQDRAFAGEEAAVIERAQAAGVEGIALCGYDAPSNLRALEIASKHGGVYPTVGFHPHEAGTVTADMLAELDSLAALEEVVAVGEIGLDFYRHHSTPEDQRRVLAAQLEIALRHGKPVCVHSRAAEDACLELLAPFAKEVAQRGGGVPGVMHCFGGTLEQALPYVELGFMVSIACVVTYPRNDEARRLARELPLDSLVIETDSPYLPPQGKRGQRNEPANVAAAAEAIAAARDMAVATVAEETTRNAERLFAVRTEVGVN